MSHQNLKVVIFGATGMVGQGVLLECLKDRNVNQVLSIGRTPLETKHAKLKELIRSDLFQYQDLSAEISGYQACFFCLGTPSLGKDEAQYSRVTYDLTVAAAKALCERNPEMTFIYVSAEGSDSSEKGPVMWARVRGRLENALFRMPFKALYIFRPGVIQPMDGIVSKTKLYNFLYVALKPVLPMFRSMFPNQISSTRIIGRAMLEAVRHGYEKKILSAADFRKLAGPEAE